MLIAVVGGVIGDLVVLGDVQPKVVVASLDLLPFDGRYRERALTEHPNGLSLERGTFEVPRRHLGPERLKPWLML